jgi:hypothetical protein
MSIHDPKRSFGVITAAALTLIALSARIAMRAAPAAVCPSAMPYLEGAERMAEEYADLMKRNPAGVVA